MAVLTICLGFPDTSLLLPESMFCLERQILRYSRCLITIRKDNLIGLSMNMCCVALCTAVLLAGSVAHTPFTGTVSPMGPDSAHNLHHVHSLANRRGAPELQRGWR